MKDKTPLERNQIVNKSVLEEETLPGLHQKILPMIEGDIIADIGCGAGHISKLLPDKKFYHFDCVNRNLPNFKRVDLSWDKLGGIKVDTALIIEVIEHLENPWNMIREAKSIANKIIVSTPVVGDLRNKLIYLRHGRFFFFFQDDDDHIQPIFRQQLYRMRGSWKVDTEFVYKDPKGSGGKVLVQKWMK